MSTAATSTIAAILGGTSPPGLPSASRGRGRTPRAGNYVTLASHAGLHCDAEERPFSWVPPNETRAPSSSPDKSGWQLAIRLTKSRLGRRAQWRVHTARNTELVGGAEGPDPNRTTPILCDSTAEPRGRRRQAGWCERLSLARCSLLGSHGWISAQEETRSA